MVSSGLEKLSADGASLENRSDSTGVRLSADVQSEALIKTLAKQNGGTAMEDMGERGQLYSSSSGNNVMDMIYMKLYSNLIDTTIYVKS